MIDNIFTVFVAIFICYIAFGAYTWLVNRNAIKLFAKAFPNEYRNYFCNKSFNEKRLAGFVFLWDRNIIDIIGSNDDIEKARKHARMCAVIFLVLILSLPILFGGTAYILHLLPN